MVNAAGVWSDEVRTLDEGTDPHSIRPAKGIHITVPEEAFPCDIAAVIPVREDKRSIFVVSWGDQVYLGTTDTGWDGPLDDPSCTPEDVDYILGAANAISTRALTRDDITGIWTGLRPLLAPEQKGASSERTADLSRRHTVRTSPGGLVTVTGGKLTTYRKMAEDTVDAVVAQTGSRAAAVPHQEPAPPRRAHRRQGRPEGWRCRRQRPARPRRPGRLRAAHLASRYGTEAGAVLALADGRPELLEPLVAGLPYLAAEALWAVRREMARSVSDVLDRRTQSSYRDARAAADAAGSVAALIGPELGWDAGRARAEAVAYADHVRARLAGAGLDPGGGPAPRRSATPATQVTQVTPVAAVTPATPAARPRPAPRPAEPRDGGVVMRPTPVTAVDAGPGGVTDRLATTRVAVDDTLVRRLADACASVSTLDDDRTEAGRDWWPLAIGWAAGGAVPSRPAVVARPTDTAQVSAVLALCDAARIPVTPAGGRSGVCGASIPLFGGVALDLCGLAGIGDVDATSLVADLRAGTFGPDVEAGLRDGHGLTLGHWPQSMDLSTVGGWLACRGAGQYSNRYGKIEDMVLGLEVVLADGRVVRTGGRGPRSATGPDLTQLFVGSEGTLGVITEGRFRVHPVPAGDGRRAFGFGSFADGLDACRRILRRGADPRRAAPLRRHRVGTVLRPGRHQRPRRAGRGRPGAGGGDARHRRPGVRGGRPARRRPGRPLARPPQRRLGPRPPVARRCGRRHRRGLRPLGGAARPVRRRPRRTGRRGGHAGRLVAPEPRLHRRRLPLLHLRRPAARGGGRRSRRSGRLGRRPTTDGPGTR